MRFEPAIPVSEQAKTFRAQDLTATVIDLFLIGLFGKYKAQSHYGTQDKTEDKSVFDVPVRNRKF
jgi:hypothetical protein